jgi:hypothetical protein
MYVRGYLQGSENGRVVTIGWNVTHWTSGVNVHNENSNRYVPF